MTPKETSKDLVQTDQPKAMSPLARALEKASGLLTDKDFDPTNREAPQLRYMCIRQKDLKGDDGKLLREAGPFRTGNISDLSFEDRSELKVTVLASKPNRVYFEDLNSAKPTCRSIDMIHGSRPREGNRFGECATCFFAQWGSAPGGRQACRENRKIFAFDWGNEKPIVLTLGPSSLKPWGRYCEAVDDVARTLRRKDGNIPFIHHFLMVPATTEYRAEPAGHFVVKLGDPIALPEDIQGKMAKFREDAMIKLETFVQEHEEEAGDFTGEPGPVAAQ